MPIPNSSTGGKISMKCIANEYGFSENTLPLSLDDLSNLIAKGRKHAMSEFSTCSFDDTATYLLVGGGGGGGSNHAGGGGAGGYYCGCLDILSNDGCQYSITIGAGGSGAACYNIASGAGSLSSFLPGSYAAGGGGGGNRGSTSDSQAISPSNGCSVPPGAGSGGGGGGGYGGHICGGSYPGAFGFGSCNGGDGYGGGSPATGGGGGGACCDGQDGGCRVEGIGGLGCRTIVKGLQEIYASGGNGGRNRFPYTCAISGAANTGIGGNGSDQGAAPPEGGNGGSGVFIISYYSPTGETRMTGGDSVVQVDNRVVHTFTSSGTLNIGNVITELNVEYLVVGSGGGICLDTLNYTSADLHFATGGAGGGQVVEGSTTMCSDCTYTVVIGAGGTGTTANLSRLCTSTCTSIGTALGGQSVIGKSDSTCPITLTCTTLSASSTGVGFYVGGSSQHTPFGACSVGVTTPPKGFQGGDDLGFLCHWKNIDDTLNCFINFNNAFANSATDLTLNAGGTGGGGGQGGVGISQTYQMDLTTLESGQGLPVEEYEYLGVMAQAGNGGPGCSPTNFSGTFGGGGGGTFLSGLGWANCFSGAGEYSHCYTDSNGNFLGPGIYLQLERSYKDSTPSRNIEHAFIFGKGGTGGGGYGSFVGVSSNSFTRNGTTHTWSSYGAPNTGGGSGGLSPDFCYMGNGYSYVETSNGGSGVVAIRYLGTSAKATGGNITICNDGYVYHCFTGSGTFSII